MKKITQVICALLIIFSTNAQQKKGIIGYTNWLASWSEFKPHKAEYPEPNQILAGNISSDTRLLKKNTYVLHGNVYVTNNAVLTIEPGTVIIGDYQTKGTLVVSKGAKIIADGLVTDPIVFTSNSSQKKAGDWGGIVILGDAPINKLGNIGSYNLDLDPALTAYGGENVSSDSGILRYVRIEFAGKNIKGIGTFNGLTAAGVGNQTTFENIMIAYCAGNSFAFYGGDVNASNLVSYKSINDDFKFTQGIQCRLYNSLAVRSSYLSSSRDGSRCLEVKLYENKNETDFTKKETFVTASNITMLNDSENINADIEAGLVKEAVYVAENTVLEIKRSVISGFNPAVMLENKTEISPEVLKKIKLEEMLFNLCRGNILSEYSTNNEKLEQWYNAGIFSNISSQNDSKETFIDLYNTRRPDFRLQLDTNTASSSNR